VLPRSVTSYPPPITKVPAAADAYARAMQDLRDAADNGGANELERAVKLDPTFAAAYLRLLAAWFQGEESVIRARELYALAQQFRVALDPRERALLEVAEAFTHQPVDWKEVVTRLRGVLVRFPDDLETLAELADALQKAGFKDEARATLERVLAIDPEFAIVLADLAGLMMKNDAATSLELLDRCLTVSPRASDCLVIRAVIERETGRCADYESTARKLVAVAPRRSVGYRLLADAVAVQGAPVEGAQALLEHAVTARLESDGENAADARDDSDLALALLVGDFPRAIAAASDQLRLRATDTSEYPHVAPALTIITSLVEEGKDADALRVAEDIEKQTFAWTLSDDRVRLYLLYARRHAGRITEADFRAQLDALQRAADLRFIGEEQLASDFWGHTANANASAVDLDVARPFLDQPRWSAHLEAIRGRLLFLSSRLDDALPALETGVRACEILPTGTGAGWQGLQAFTFMHSRLWLGEALEAQGDTAGACTNYAVVTQRWKNAKPRSVTLDEAKAHARALHCP
jgi:Tfp pilus assembly protein PilF